MNRRDAVLALLALGTAASPRVAMPQTSPTIPTLGYLSFGAAKTAGDWDRSPLTTGLKALGWVEGKTLRIERAYADKKHERLAVLAGELVRKKVDLIYAQGPDSALAAIQATKTIPIVFSGVTYPVEMGLVDSYARPGRNATGVAWSAGNEVYAKLLEFVRELAPAAGRVAYLRPATRRSDAGYWAEAAQKLVAAAKKLGFELRIFNVARPEDFDPAFKAIQAWRAQALYSISTPLTSVELQRIVDFTNAIRIPGFFDSRAFAKAGGFFSFGPEVSQMFAQAAGKVDRILRGASPATLPVEMPTHYEIYVNRKTAANLGIKIPQSILLRADRVIE